jgi:hypothetical protein
MFKIKFGNYYELFCANLNETKICRFGNKKPDLLNLPVGQGLWVENTIEEWWDKLKVGRIKADESKWCKWAIDEIITFMLKVELAVEDGDKVADINKKKRHNTTPEGYFVNAAAHTEDVNSLITCYFFIGRYGVTEMSLVWDIHKR